MDPKFPVPCPAKNGVAASCWAPGTDCSTVTSCNGTPAACMPNRVVDCAMQKCVATTMPPPGDCTYPAFPTYCPPVGAYKGGCFETGTACSTVVDCGGDHLACKSTDYVSDCVDKEKCLPAAQCPYASAANDCQKCIVHKCCTLVNQCAQDTTCKTNKMGTLWDTYLGCVTTYCTADCQ